MPTQSLVDFILYVLPGFLAIEIFRSAYPGKSKDNFSLITWSIIFGVIIVSFTKWIDGKFLNNYLKSNVEGFPSFKYVLTILFGGLIAGFLRIFIHFIRFKLSLKYNFLKKIAPNHLSIWAKINQPDNNNWAVVFLDDGSIYLGYISDYKFDPDSEDQDFLLKDAKRVDEDLKKIYDVNGLGVYLNTRNVKKIEFLEGD